MNAGQAFDPLAPSYDQAFTDTLIGRYLRGQVHARLDTHFQPGDHVLELGCGTGEDALYLAGRGVRVNATDVSAGMLAIARAKTAGNSLVSVEHLDLRCLPQNAQHPAPSTQHFAGVFSNFGALNCLDDWRPLAAWLAARVQPGSIAAFGVMSPFCLWEPLWHGLHLDFKTATRRWRKKTLFQPLPPAPSPYRERGGADRVLMPVPITVRYPTIRRFTGDFAPWFSRTYVRGLGLFLPPSDVFGVIEKRPWLLKLLMGLEERYSHSSRLAPLADHYWIEFERTNHS
jgi:SAM-dependent methyltransferase